MSSPAPFRSGKSLLLLVAAIAAIFLLAILPFNNYAVSRFSAFAKDIPDQTTRPDITFRQREWYGAGYIAAKKIEAAIAQSHFKGSPLILLQPNTYFRANKLNVEMPEPAIFYNYTGLHAIWKNSNMVKVATHLVEITPKGMKILVVHNDTASISAFLGRYAAYDIAL